MNLELYKQANRAAQELCVAANLKPGDIMVVGCSSSEVTGGVIGKNSSVDAAEAVFTGICDALNENGVYLAAQCCEHLNRAIIIDPVALEHIKADAGLDIGGTLIGMHLKHVAVPVRLSMDHIGSAILLAARTRPKYIGGERAVYPEE